MHAVDRTKYMDEQEAKVLLAVTENWAVRDLRAGRVTGPLAWVVVDTALQTGLRVSELARLTVGDFDAKRGALRVWRHKRKEHKQETMAIGRELVDHLNGFVTWKGLVGQPVKPTSPLFVGQRGALTAHGLQQVWKSATRRAELPAELSIHSARHTMAVHLLRKTGNLRQVQKQLGHTSPVTTANMYADVSFEDMQNGVNGLYQ